MDVFNEQWSTSILGTMSRYPKVLIFKTSITYKHLDYYCEKANVLTLLQTTFCFNAVVAFGFVLNTLISVSNY